MANQEQCDFARLVTKNVKMDVRAPHQISVLAVEMQDWMVDVSRNALKVIYICFLLVI